MKHISYISIFRRALLIILLLYISLFNTYCQYDIISLLDSAELKQEKEPLVALDYALKAKMQSEYENDQQLLSQSYYQIGKIYRILGDLVAAEDNLNKALFYKSNNQALLADYYNEKGIILKQQSRFDEALELYNETLLIQQKEGNIKGEARSYNNIGRIYEAMENYHEAFRYYQKALLIYDKLPITKSTAITLQNIGNIYRATEVLDSAMLYYQNALSIYEFSENKLLIAYVYNSIAAVTADRETAIAYLNKSIKIQKEINAELDLGKSYVELAEVYIKYKQFEAAIPYLINGYELFASSRHKNSARDALKYLYQTYKSLGDYENALKYQTIYFAYQDSIKSENNSNAMQRYESELNLKDKEIQIAINELEINSSNEKLELRKKQILFSIVGISLLIILLFLVVLQVFRQRRNNVLLNSQKLQIEKRDKEKEVLIREVHHRVKNNLQIILSLLAMEQRKSKNNEVKDALAYGKQRIEAMSLIHEKLYQQSDLSNIYLEDYLLDIAENLLFSFDKTNIIKLIISSDILSIDTDIAINLGLITAELMTNSIKHGYNPQIENFKISILVTETNNTVAYKYSDNGIGIVANNTSEEVKSFGQKLILSIIKKLKGEITINPKSNLGFELSFNFNKEEYE